MTGRPPATVAGRVRSNVKRLAGVHGTIAPRERFSVMRALLGNVHQGFKFGGQPNRGDLERLAAHAIAWAEEIERGGNDDHE